MKPNGLSPHYQGPPATCPHPETDQFSPCLFIILLSKIHFNIILPSTPRSFMWSLSLRSPHKKKTCMHLSCPPYVPNPAPRPMLLDLITRMVFDVQVTVMKAHNKGCLFSDQCLYRGQTSYQCLPWCAICYSTDRRLEVLGK